MFDIAFSELVLIGLLALIILGPKRLPEVARAAGRWTARIRRFVADVKQDFDRELQQADMAEFRKLKDELADTRRLMEETTGQLAGNLAATASAANLELKPAADTKSSPAPTVGASLPAATTGAAMTRKPRKKSRPKTKNVAARKSGRIRRD
jgi:sec-independent protein translocase protein TatB